MEAYNAKALSNLDEVCDSSQENHRGLELLVEAGGLVAKAPALPYTMLADAIDTETERESRNARSPTVWSMKSKLATM